jgi:hypothetical protein
MKTKNFPYNPKFTEIQKQGQAWIFILILLLLFVNIAGIIQQVILDIPFGNHAVSDLSLFLLLLIPISLLIFLSMNKLVTHLDNEGIWLKYFPYHQKYRLYKWEEMQEVYVRLYRPLKEYGGYGFRYKLKGKSRAINVSGNTGIQIHFKDGTDLLIGTRAGYEMKKYISAMREKFDIQHSSKTDSL